MIVNKVGRLLQSFHRIYRVQCATKFWEPDRRAGYDTQPKELPLKEQLKNGAKLWRPELERLKEEWKAKMLCDNIFDIKDGDFEIVWKFDNPQSTEDWIVTADSDFGEGKSSAQFVLGRNKTGLFEGCINTDPPKDGKIKRAGYATIKSPLNFKSFKRKIPYDWSRYTHLLVRCRGDGRAYQFIAHMDRYFDIAWHDNYSYAIFTRGGPYWQTAMIPFSKFYLSHRGRIQDKQETLMTQLDRISHVTVTCSDDCPGPFHFEIDYIGLVYDQSHKETFAYEMYQVSPYIHD